MNIHHRIALHGPRAGADRISGHLLRDLLDAIVEGAERALRFRLEGRSTARGPSPKWLRPAADFSVQTTTTARELSIHATTLLEAMPDRFRTGDLFVDLDPGRSAIDLFEDAIEDAVAGNEDSDRLDAQLVETVEKLTGLFEQGVTQVEIVNGRTIRIDRAGVARVRQLAAKVYAPQRVKVAGQLDAIRYSDCRFTLRLEGGSVLQGTAVEAGHEVLKNLFGSSVIVTGLAVFRASGRPLRIEADKLEPASEQDSQIWSALPKPLLAPSSLRQLREQQRGKEGLSALLGKWPGQESDEEVRAALESLS